MDEIDDIIKNTLIQNDEVFTPKVMNKREVSVEYNSRHFLSRSPDFIDEGKTETSIIKNFVIKSKDKP